MRKGKMVAQGAHASMKVIVDQGWTERGSNLMYIKLNPEIREWLSGAFTKICVYVNSEDELLDVYYKAKEEGLLASIIRDNGTTEFNGIKTYTAVAIGPAKLEDIDKITGKLKLL